ncbi:hypothetical protein AURDEDRAFT_69651 [Auricularia subglabra TFB-10046 SS5]|nr:hypothetical protein AURDEDRAFT_69651 [Auricularia subglabra TFB-10046 SS5]
MADLLTLLDAEDDRRREAALALPHAFDKCTYSLGHIRQAVYLCLTCALPRGVCSACSIACHGDHEQVELFPKRDFQCDCPTSALPHKCALVPGVELPPNASNAYGHNFKNEFCRCGRPYDAKTERETMIQCLACEDWFHESCLNLRERVPPATGTTPPREVPQRPENAEDDDDDDVQSCASDPDLPPALLARDDYDALICGACARNMPFIQRYAGTSNFLLVTRADESSPWTVLGREAEVIKPELEDASTSSSGSDTIVPNGKRPLDTSEEVAGPSAKKARLDASPSTPTSSSTCKAPPLSESISRIYSQPLSTPPSASSASSGDIFLTGSFRDQLCRCASCAPPAYLLEDEETYEPPEDPDVGLSLEELGLRALASGALPHVQAVEGARLFNHLRDDLASFLRPFASEGRVVGEEDVRAFFERKREELRAHLAQQAQ